jgi:hypothetical protein
VLHATLEKGDLLYLQGGKKRRSRSLDQLLSILAVIQDITDKETIEFQVTRNRFWFISENNRTENNKNKNIRILGG